MIRELTKQLHQDETVQPRDWIEWARGAWTRVAVGSVFVGKTVDSACGGGALGFRRDLDDDEQQP